jgi:hypothetical protein
MCCGNSGKLPHLFYCHGAQSQQSFLLRGCEKKLTKCNSVALHIPSVLCDAALIFVCCTATRGEAPFFAVCKSKYFWATVLMLAIVVLCPARQNEEAAYE